MAFQLIIKNEYRWSQTENTESEFEVYQGQLNVKTKQIPIQNMNHDLEGCHIIKLLPHQGLMYGNNVFKQAHNSELQKGITKKI